MKNIYNREKSLDGSQSSRLLIYLLGIGLIIRLIGAPMVEGFSSDMNLFRFWAEAAARDLTGIYRGGFFLDYPPFYLYFLFFIGKIADLFNLVPGSPLYILLLKMPSIAADIITAYLLYRISKGRLSERLRLFLTSIYLFNPAIFINAAIWGQVDSFLTMLLALGFMLLTTKKPHLSAIAFAAAIMTKPQGLIFMPVVLFAFLKDNDYKVLLKALGIGLATILVIILPFSFNQKPLWIVELFFNTASGYEYASLNAFNFFALIGANLRHDSLSFLFFDYKTWGFFFIFLVTLYTAFIYFKGKGPQLPYLGALVLSVGVFVLSVRMHERYLFPSLFFFLVVFIYTKDRVSLILYAATSFTVFINTYVVLARMIADNYPHVPPDNKLLILVSLINVLILMGLVIWSWDRCVGKLNFSIFVKITKKKKDGNKINYDCISRLSLTRNDKSLMIIMTVVYLLFSLFNLGSLAAPQTQWEADNLEDGFILDVGSPMEISRLTYFAGLGDGKFDISLLDKDGIYQDLVTVETAVDEFYKWGVVDISAHTRFIKVEVVKPGGVLKEIAIFREHTTEPLMVNLLHLDGTPVTKGTLLKLVDEQDIAEYRPSYKTGTYFDEIYHARTAYEHLNRIQPYEWTHPPLGKILISAGIALFGMNPFGWRIIGMLVGAAMIPLMYVFGKRLFDKSYFAFCAAFLMMFDLMHFAQTRIATIDVYTTFFVILMYYFMADYYLSKSYDRGFYQSLKPLFLSGLFFGLGIATKWSVLYGAPGLAILFLMSRYNEYKDYRRDSRIKELQKKRWTDKFWSHYIKQTVMYCALFFIVVPGIIYFLSYIPYLLVPGIEIKDIFKYQISMYDYHSKLDATHFFSSEWWSWPLIIRPMWYYMGIDLPPGKASTIASFGNPAIWWVGILACVSAFRHAFKGNKSMVLVFIAILSQYLPWILVPRIAFIYHFFPILPFVMLAIVFGIKSIIDKGYSKNIIYGYLIVVALVFAFFYPAISGLVVNESYINGLKWLPSWIF